MRTRRLELAVGLGLLLGPLVYALTLDAGPASECAAKIAGPTSTVETETVTVTETVVVERCEQPVSPEPKRPALRELMLVGDAGLVLTTDARREWGTGRFFEPPGTAQHRVAKRADPDSIPTELWSLRGRAFDLYGPDGKVCTARLGELSVVAQYGWGLGGVLGDEWYDEDETNASQKQIREGLWQRDDLWLVAAIESRDSCEGALWARDAELPPAEVVGRNDGPNWSSIAKRESSERLAELELLPHDPVAIFDADGDGHYELLYSDFIDEDLTVISATFDDALFIQEDLVEVSPC